MMVVVVVIGSTAIQVSIPEGESAEQSRSQYT